MNIRRSTRLTSAFSKKLENHAYAVALHQMFYNFTRIHLTLRVTPAMATGVTDRLWEMTDIVKVLEDWEAEMATVGTTYNIEQDRIGEGFHVRIQLATAQSRANSASRPLPTRKRSLKPSARSIGRDEGERQWVPDMGKALKFACFFGLVILVGSDLLHWAATGELTAISKGGGLSRTLSWEHEPGQLIFTAIVKIGLFLVGGWGMIDTLRGDNPPPQAPE